MDDKEKLTTVVAIGENTRGYLEKIHALIKLEEPDVIENDGVFDHGLEICQFCFISTCSDLNTSIIKDLINDTPVCFVIIDASDKKTLAYARQLGDYISTLNCGLSIALLFGVHSTTLQYKDYTTELYSNLDVIIELDTLASDEAGKVVAAYNIIRGINSTLVKPLLNGFDLADLHLHLKSSGLLQVAWAIENAELDNSNDNTVCIATESALEIIKKRIVIEEVRSVFIFIEGCDSLLNLKHVENSVMMLNNTFPESSIEWVVSRSRTIGNAVRVLIGAANI